MRRKCDVMDAQEIFNLFEGQCPVCKKAVKLVMIGGLPNFLRDNVPQDFKGNVNKWLPRLHDDDHVDGSESFTCVDGHESYVEHTDYGDWL